MAEIDNLNFKVIIDDAQFNQKIKEMEKLAQKFNTSMSNLLNVKKASQQWSQKEVQNNRRALQAKVDEARAQEKINREKIKSEGLQRKINAQVDRASKGYQNQDRLLKELQGYALSYFSIQGAARLVSSLVRITGEFELQKTTLAAMLGDLDKAEQIVANIKGLAVESPFQFKELTTYAKQLSAFSVPAEELFETTKMLADVSAGLGVSMDRIVLAYGQVRSAAFLRGQEVRQFTEAGIPILNELAKQFTELEGRAVSAGEVFDKISARLVPFEMVAKVLKDMTAEGGQFYEMQSVQAETLKGKVANLKDAYEIMLNEIGSKNSNKLKGAVDSVRSLMLNWEKVGMVLQALIVSFGLYKATLATVWAWEKILAVGDMIKRYNALNAKMLAMTGSTKKLATALRVSGIAAKTAAGLGIAAVGALAAIIITAAVRAGELKRELDAIMTSQAAESNKAIDGMDALVRKLEGAVQGSQDYRDAISEMNRKYGEYLPNLLTEKNSLEEVKRAANEAAQALRNKAKASAFEKGSQAIEDDFGKKLTDRTRAFRNALTNMPNISKKAANEFINNFNLALGQPGALDDVERTLKETFDSYFGEGKFKEYEVSFSLGTLVWDAEQYAKIRKKVIKAEEDLQADLDARFSESGYSSLEEREQIAELNKWYKEEENALKALEQTQEQYNDSIEKLNIEKLERLVALYTNLGRLDVAKDYQEQLDALRKMQTGWKGIVNEVLRGRGLTKNTSFGLWTDDYTQSVNYVEDMIKRYKELKEQIDLVSTFDKDQAKRLTQNKEAIEAVAKALNLDLESLISKTSKKKSDAQIELETQIDLVKKLQDAYEKLFPYLNEEQMRDTLSKLFPEAKAEWLKSFDFSEVLKKLADDLAKYDEEASKKLKASVGKDVAASLADAFKEVKAYKDMLDEWFGQDFSIEGKGVAFDVSKIIRDLNNQYAKIDQKRLKAQELLKKAQEGDEQSLAIIRMTYGEEFWQEYVANGKQAIDELAEAEKASAKAVADERIRDLADKYLKERMEKENVDLTDFEDKTLSQVDTQLNRLRDIRDKINEEILAIEEDGVTDEELPLLDNLKEQLRLLGIIIEDTDVEKEKKIFDLAKAGADAIADLGKEIESLGEAMGNTMIAQLGKGIDEIAKLASNLMDALQSKDFVSLIANMTTAVISYITDVVTAARQEQEALNEAALEYAELMLNIRRESYSGIYGTDEMALAAENAKILAEAQREYQDVLKGFENDKSLRIQRYYNGDAGGFKMEYKKMSVSDVLGNIADEQGWELYRESGELNMDALVAYYDAYAKHLTKKQREVVDALISSYDAQNDAAAQSAEYMTSLFSSAADTIAEKMVGAFIESGDAATDLRGVVSDVASQMASDLIKTLYIMPILNQYAEDLKAISANDQLTSDEKTAAALGILQTGVEQIRDNEDAINETLAKLDEYFVRDEEGTKDLGEGIKGITEDQASLLASYLNAIRADVSYSKALWVKMDANLQRIADMLTSSPTLMEYQARIAANTYNTAVATQEILSELRGVISFDTGDAAIRVNS